MLLFCLKHFQSFDLIIQEHNILEIVHPWKCSYQVTNVELLTIYYNLHTVREKNLEDIENKYQTMSGRPANRKILLLNSKCRNLFIIMTITKRKNNKNKCMKLKHKHLINHGKILKGWNNVMAQWRWDFIVLKPYLILICG